MSQATRLFVGTSLLALLVAALLHVAFLLGYAALWPALIHLLLLGWISAMIYAVNYHMLPVFSGRDFPSPGALRAHWLLLTLGVLTTTIGLAATWQTVTLTGLVLELAGAIVFVYNTIALFRRGSPRPHRPPRPAPEQQRIDRLSTLATKTSGFCLPLALMLMLGIQARWIGGSWWLAAEHLITLGWVLLMIVGVAYHVLPRFSGRALRGWAWAVVQLGSHVLALVLLVSALGIGRPVIFALGGGLMAVSLGLFAWTIWPTFGQIQRIVLKERPG